MSADAAAAAAEIVAGVPDPELPHVTIGDLGMVHSVDEHDGRVEVVITPTYTGCPATEAICDAVADALREHGWADAQVSTTLTPAWSTSWISEEGREKLRRAGIAPPPVAGEGGVLVDLPPACPRCGSLVTRKISDFGSTACKAPYVCKTCREPFEHFKPL